ncbi:MAG: helix-turn-helix transcriptional regulator [Erysipelotrichaceae bacterium]|nr:helix-turn-helix transcriptional regulator [Erysipelotrichaceae bacterium]
MRYSYKKLWIMLIEKELTKTELRLQTGSSTNMLARMGKDEAVSLDTLVKIATHLECGIDDIFEFSLTDK